VVAVEADAAAAADVVAAADGVDGETEK